jgi:hypothetical protein
MSGRSSHLVRCRVRLWSRPHGANHRCHIPRLSKPQATNSWDVAQFRVLTLHKECCLYRTNNQVNPAVIAQQGFENVRGVFVFS